MNFEKPEKSEFWKKKWKKRKLLEISFYTCVPKTIIIWGTVPVIQSEANFGHFLPFTSPPPPQQQQQPRKPKFWRNEKSIRRSHNFKLVQQKAQSNYVCLLRYGLQQTFFCHFRLFFFALLPCYWPQKLNGKLTGKKSEKHLEILSFDTCAP